MNIVVVSIYIQLQVEDHKSRNKNKMASNTQGIQQLLAAEKKAAEKVGEARKRKYFFLFLFLFDSVRNEIFNQKKRSCERYIVL